MRKIIGLIFLSGTLYSGVAFGQASTCTQTLRLVQSTYEQGRLHELEALMQGCLENGFDDQQKVTAYKYLTLAYIYLEEPEKADATMLKLLSTGQAGHFFATKEDVDPAEFVALWRKFRRDPLFRVGIKLGPTSTMPAITETYYVVSTAAGNGKFSPKVNFSFGLVFEKDFYKFLNKFSIAPEVMFVGRSTSYTNPKLSYSDQNLDNTAISLKKSIQKQRWLDLNLLAQYKLKEKATKFNTYVSVGPGISYLINSTNELETKVEEKGSVTGSAIKTKDSYRSLAYSAIISMGSKIRVGGFYLTGDIRYQCGLNNVVNKSSRSIPEALYNYGYVPSNYRQNNVTLNVGLAIPYFSPKKLIK